MSQPRPAPGAETRPSASWHDYLAMARPEHWVKHVFIVPGIVLAYLLDPTAGSARALSVLAIALGFASAAAVASANYVLNEWLDAESDVFHPTKSGRVAVGKQVHGGWVALEYLLLAGAGLALAAQVSSLYLVTSAAFLGSGLLYNVRPLRSKDVVYLDVLSEAVNNPIRLTLGWAMVDASTLPPGSVLLAYWLGGAFLMAVKRLAEYRAVAETAGVAALGRYRKSFRRYTERSLLVSTFLYAQLAAFFLAVFLIKYRVEYLLSLPFFAALFGAYLHVGLKRASAAQQPERLFRERSIVLLLALLSAALVILTVVDLPLLERLSSPHYIELPLR